MLLFLHRKDLRTTDLTAFEYIAQRKKPSVQAFIMDPILLEDRINEHSGQAFLASLARLVADYHTHGTTLNLLYGKPAEVLHELFKHVRITELVFHEDNTPYAQQRDNALREVAAAHGVQVTTFLDHMLITPDQLDSFASRNDSYKVFTPYYRKWATMLEANPPAPYTTSLRVLQTPERLTQTEDIAHLGPPDHLRDLLRKAAKQQPQIQPEEQLLHFFEHFLAGYAAGRDAYAREETSRMSIALNHGRISPRKIISKLLLQHNYTDWLRQLAWRDFYYYQAYRDPNFFTYEKQYDLSPLDDRHFDAWAEAQTGVPIVDAAMTQLNATGWMPNRLRMVCAMFLTKNLLCPFSLGEQYFRRKLADYDHTLNRGGWLWCASMGYDPAPYFRIMNPVSQSEKFDPQGIYLRRWLPHLAGLPNKLVHQPQQEALVDLKGSRALAIEVYRGILAAARRD